MCVIFQSRTYVICGPGMGRRIPMLCRSGIAKFVRTPALYTVAAPGLGRPFTSMPTSVVVPPALAYVTSNPHSELRPRALACFYHVAELITLDACPIAGAYPASSVGGPL